MLSDNIQRRSYLTILLFLVLTFTTSIMFQDAEARHGYAHDYAGTATKAFVGIIIIIATIIVIVLFAVHDEWRWKWEDSTGYQKLVSIGIGIPLWLAMFAILIGNLGYLVGGILITVSCVIATLHVSRWKSRKNVEDAYEKYYSKSSDDDEKTYYKQSSNTRNDYSSNPHDRTSYKESEYEKEEYSHGRYEDSEFEEDEEEDKEDYEEEIKEPESSLKKYYTVLDVNEDASPKEIKRAYRKLVKQWHPDSHKSDKRKQIAESEIKKINHAYEQLEKAGKLKN